MVACWIGADTPNVIGQPRRELARRVQHDDLDSGFHFEVDEEARGVTDPGVGCTDWLGHFLHWRIGYRRQGITFSEQTTISETASPRRFPESAGTASPPARKLRLLT
jgi:hypothetical protein